MDACAHYQVVPTPEPEAKTEGCEECLPIGQSWVHLRKCLVCGHVGCCDSSVGKHAAKHYHATEHPVIRTNEPGENWSWCYVDRAYRN